MLDILRANARSALTYVLFGIIIVVFVVSFGPGSCGSAGNPGGGGAPVTGTAASVNGEKIGAAELEQHYGQIYRAYQQQAGESFSRELAERLGLRRVALDQLVERALVRQDARRHGLVVGDEDLERAIKENPAFQAGGRFDHDYYVRAVTAGYGTAARFEERLREDLLVQKMVALVRQTAKVSDDEVKEAFLAEGDRASLELVRFPLSLARAEAKVTPAEVAAFAGANGERVKQHYEANKAKYDRAKRVKARHVLVKAAETEAGDAAQKKAEAVAERARKGEDFAKLAQEASEDAGTKDRGGDLGWFGAGVMAKPFEDAAFAAKAGEVAGPVRTRFGFHVVKVDEVQEAQAVPFEQVKDAVAREVLEADRAQALARRKAEETLAALKAGKGLQDLFPADEPGKKPVKWGGQVLRPDETGSFTAQAAAVSIPRIGAEPELAKATFAVDGPKVLDRVFDTAAGPLVARVKERQRPDPAQLAQKKGELTERLRSRREAELERAWVKGLRDAADLKVDEKIAGAPGLASLGQ